MEFHITLLEPEDWPAVGAIYAEGLATGKATFETELPAWEKWDNAHRKDCRLVARESGQRNNVIGWAALSPVSYRQVYAGVAEVSVYVSQAARGRGVGRALLDELIEASEHAGVWTLQAGIFPENIASLKLHKTHGFHELGVRRRIGQLGGIWRDVLLLERRSSVVGT
jgi:L-amino acid N-acyltransferase YncA